MEEEQFWVGSRSNILNLQCVYCKVSKSRSCDQAEIKFGAHMQISHSDSQESGRD